MTRMPHIQLGDEINTRMAILPGDPKRVERIAKHFDTADDYGMSREYRSIAGTYKGRRILAMSTGMGGPSAAIAVEELAKLGVDAEILPNDAFFCTVEGDGGIVSRLSGFDFVVYLDKDKYVARMLQKCGVRLFNRAEAIEDCDDKMLTAIRLANAGIPMPPTVPGLLCYDENAPLNAAAMDRAAQILGYPLVVKSSYGSLGSGVHLARDAGELKDICQKLKCSPHLFQKFIAESSGRDARVIVVGGEVTAAMTRTAHGDFRSNLELGGSGSPLVPDDGLAELCRRVARHICLDYCGIDILFGSNGYLVCEVNSNAFFGGIERVTGINVAAAYAAHMYRSVYGGE